jgi:hypothetical protein
MNRGLLIRSFLVSLLVLPALYLLGLSAQGQSLIWFIYRPALALVIGASNNAHDLNVVAVGALCFLGKV